MLKAIIFLLGDIFGLGMPSGSASLCSKREAAAVRSCRHQDAGCDRIWQRSGVCLASTICSCHASKPPKTPQTTFRPLTGCFETDPETEELKKKKKHRLQRENDGDVGIQPLSTRPVYQLIFGGSSSVFSTLDRNCLYNAVHTPVLHQRVEGSAK